MLFSVSLFFTTKSSLLYVVFCFEFIKLKPEGLGGFDISEVLFLRLVNFEAVLEGTKEFDTMLKP